MATIDPVLEVLIAEMHRQGFFGGEAIANMSRRLTESGEAGLAEQVVGIVLANSLDTPEARRSLMHPVSGGNED